MLGVPSIYMAVGLRLGWLVPVWPRRRVIIDRGTPRCGLIRRVLRVEVAIEVDPDHPGVLPEPGDQRQAQDRGQQDQPEERPPRYDQVFDQGYQSDQGDRQGIADIHRPREMPRVAPVEVEPTDRTIVVHRP